MAVLEIIRNFFAVDTSPETEEVVPAPPAAYSIHPLTLKNLNEILRLNLRCFYRGDNYTKHTFDYLLNEPRTLSYCVQTEKGDIVSFAFLMVNDNGSAHLTTIGVAPEHRRRGIAVMMLDHLEKALLQREIGTLMLEVRVGNVSAQELYLKYGFYVVQRIAKYYSNGEDCFLMMKPIK